MSRLYPLSALPQALLNTGYVRAAKPEAEHRQRMLRRGQAVMFYSGRNGTGKSLCAVYDSMPDLDAGRTVLSTVRLLDYGNPRPCEGWWGRTEEQATACPLCALSLGEHQQAHPAYVPFTDWPQLLGMGKFGYGNPPGVTGSICLMDEVTGIADSSESGALPSMVANELAQLRRAGVVLRLTGLNFIRANKRIREACLGVTRCESFLPVDVEGEDTLWRPRRLAIWRTYDAKSLPIDDIKDSHWEEADLIVKSRQWIPTSPAIAAYDTLAPVDRVGMLTDSGLCAYCYGKRQPHECICEPYIDEKLSRKGVHAEARSAEHGARRNPRHVSLQNGSAA